jgi:hypothetical protein
MKKSILDQFAADAINAPVGITGGGGKCGKKSKSSKSKSSKSKSSKSKSSKSRSGNYCPPPPPPPCY